MRKIAIIITLSYYFIQGVLHNLGHVVTPTYVGQNNIPDFMFGIFFAAMSFGLLVGAPLWGILGDQRAKKPFIVLGLLTYSVGQIAFVLTTNLVLMTLFRFLSGFGVSAAVTLILSHLIGLSDTTNRTKLLSLSAALLALGTTVGYYIGGILGEVYIREMFFIQGITNALYALFVFVTMREGSVFKASHPKAFFKHFKAAASLSPSLLMFLLALTLSTMSAITLTKYLDIYIIRDLGASTRELGTFVMITGFVGMATNFIVVPLLVRLKQDMRIMRYLQVFSAIIVFIVFRSENIMLALYTLYLLYIVLKSTFQPLEQNYISLNAKDAQYGTIMGVRQAFFSTGMVLGPLVSGFLYTINPILVFDVSAFMFIGAFVLLTFSQNALKKDRKTQHVMAQEATQGPAVTMYKD